MLIRKATEHRLGNHIPPIDPKTGKPIDNWQDYAWKRILAEGLALEPPNRPDWVSQIALTELSIPNPAILNWFATWNRNTNYSDSVKPYNRFVHATVKEQKGEKTVTPVSPVDGRIENSFFVNIHDPEGKEFRIIASRQTYPDSQTKFGETYEDLISQHGLSKESKFMTSSAERVTGRTRGLLIRQPILESGLLHIGKEANEFDLVQAGLVDREEEVLNVYERDPWEELQPIVAKMAISEIMRITGYSRRMAYAIKAGERRPSKHLLLKLLTRNKTGRSYN